MLPNKGTLARKAALTNIYKTIRASGALRCELCHKWFQNFRFLKTHIKKHTQLLKKSCYLCKLCGKVFSSNPYLQHHLVSSHRCHICSKNFATADTLRVHKTNHRRTSQRGGNSQIARRPTIFAVSSAFNCFRIYTYAVPEASINLFNYFAGKLDDIKASVGRMLSSIGAIKLQIVTHVKFHREVFFSDCEDSLWEYFDVYLNSELRVILNNYESEEQITEIFRFLNARVECYERYSSNWKLCEVLKFDLRINKYKPLGGSCYVPTPQSVRNKRCVINVRNNDNQCFKWAVLAALFPSKQNQNKVCTYRKHENELEWDQRWFPMQLNTISLFEEANNVAINVFSWDETEGIAPVRKSKHNYKNAWKTVNLLHLQGLSHQHPHFATITQLSMLLGKHNHHKHVLCYNCLQKFPAKADLNKHLELCKEFKLQRVVLPAVSESGEKPVLKFKNYSKQLKAKFVVYADFESILAPSSEPATKTVDKYSQHQAHAFSYALVRDDGHLVRQFLYRGEDCMEVFFKELQQIGQLVQEIMKSDVGPTDDDEDWDRFYEEELCHICEKPLDDDRVFDHCHLTGKCFFLFRNTRCAACS